jgi:hypothetical protein
VALGLVSNAAHVARTRRISIAYSLLARPARKSLGVIFVDASGPILSEVSCNIAENLTDSDHLALTDRCWG